MKSIKLVAALIATMSFNTIFAQDTTKIRNSALLSTYYQLKDNLVKSNATAVASSADAFIKAVNEAEKETVNEATKELLLADANAISKSKDINSQREKFSGLSDRMFELAKAHKLSTEPIYQQHCPMKKVSWLSNSKAIKNPYYGSAMLTCGNVKQIL